MATKKVLTEAERKEHARESQRKWLAKVKAQKAAAEKAAIAAMPNYEGMYKAELEKNTTLENRCNELGKLCKSFAEKENQANTALQKATIEYNARIKYMLDCVRHAQISMQFAAMAMTEKTKEGEKHND